MQSIETYINKVNSTMEEMNKNNTIYLCIDCENRPTFGTNDRKKAVLYAKHNYCTISEYPKGTYTKQEV